MSIKSMGCPFCGCRLFRILKVQRRLFFECVDCGNDKEGRLAKGHVPTLYTSKNFTSSSRIKSVEEKP